MSRLTFFFAALILLLAVGAPPSAHAASCREAVDAWVALALTEELEKGKKTLPFLKEMSEQKAYKELGTRLIQTQTPRMIANGYLMLMFHGDQETINMVGEKADALETQRERELFSYALGLFQLRTLRPDIAAKGRNNLRKVRDGGNVRFVSTKTLNGFIEECEIAK
jgi:hypothetical protein